MQPQDNPQKLARQDAALMQSPFGSAAMETRKRLAMIARIASYGATHASDLDAAAALQMLTEMEGCTRTSSKDQRGAS